ncbi:hypothetical protein K501DRAFT_332434, partial [Backusella circina FSU 941]
MKVADEDCISRRISLKSTEIENNAKIDENPLPSVKAKDFNDEDQHIPVSEELETSEEDELCTPTLEMTEPEPKKAERPSDLTSGHLKTSVKLDDTESEGRPSVYLFIFVNPLSGDRKGDDLVHLPIQHFRLRKFPQVQVEIHNILDVEDREMGIKNIQLVETMVSYGKIPPNLPQKEHNSESSSSDSSKTSNLSETTARLSDAVQSRQIHVWSAGGDGTVMSVFELLVAHKIDLDLVFFSCIPFGTGNDFSQVLGWGRTLPEKNVLGSRLHNLEQLISDRLEKSEAARLDIWQVTMQSHEGGYVRQAGPKERRDGHDVAEVKEPPSEEDSQLIRKMSNYMSIGVQGYVGSGFEAHRAGNRLMNMLVYAHESSKWVFWRRFPDLSRFIENISQKGKVVLKCPSPEERKDGEADDDDIPEMTNNPIDFVIQNIPHIWGREVDLWGDAKSGLESVKNRKDFTDPNNWKPQRANDGRLEVMTIENMRSYLKKLANVRDHVSRLGQFDSPFEINFRPPSEHQKERDRIKNPSIFEKTKVALKDKTRNKYEKMNTICIMCDGEFYEIKNPKSVKFYRFAQIWTIGRDDDEYQGRLVGDELAAAADDMYSENKSSNTSTAPSNIDTKDSS